MTGRCVARPQRRNVMHARTADMKTLHEVRRTFLATISFDLRGGHKRLKVLKIRYMVGVLLSTGGRWGMNKGVGGDDFLPISIGARHNATRR